jgi:hypothetical protein
VPDLTGLPALDVAIGLAFLFFLLSTVCSAANETIASVLGWRAKTLEDAIAKVLDDAELKRTAGQKLGDLMRGAVGRLPKGPSDPAAVEERSKIPEHLTTAVLGHWRIRALVQNPESKRRRRSRPSYLSAKAFSLAVAETLASGPASDSDQDKKSPWELADEEIFERANAAIEKLPEGLRPLLRKAATNASHTLEGFRKHLETAFDEAMERASGWYKRKVQIVIAVIAGVLAVGLNVDTLQVGTGLWKDPALRSAVVAKAGAAQEPDTAATPATDEEQSPAAAAAKEIEQVEELNLPIGWGSDNAPESLSDGIERIPGWAITVAALMLGAPFWFDVLSRFSRLRGAGAPESPRRLSDAEPSGGL